MNNVSDNWILVLPDGTTYEGRAQFDDDGRMVVQAAECGVCGFRWNDALITSVTPVPSGRCPNERDPLHGFDNDHEREAYKIGVQHAKNAASWIIDGNTDRKFIVSLLKMIDDGDPRMDEGLPRYPGLSGEYAGDANPSLLFREVMGRDSSYQDADLELMEALCDAYEEGVSDTFMVECERILRAAIEPEDTSEDPCTDHGFEVCPDCGNAGTKIGADGYEPCTRFLTCWSDPS